MLVGGLEFHRQVQRIHIIHEAVEIHKGISRKPRVHLIEGDVDAEQEGAMGSGR